MTMQMPRPKSPAISRRCFGSVPADHYSQAFSTSSPFVLSTEYELQFTVIIEVAPASISPVLTLFRAPGHPPVV